MKLGPNGRSRLLKIFNAELNLFLASLRIGPVTEAEDMRAGVIGFIATFAPEALDPQTRRRLVKEVRRIQADQDYRRDLWWRIAYLECAAYFLTNDPAFVQLLAANLSHHNSSIRRGLIPAFELAAPRLRSWEVDILTPIRHLLMVGAKFAPDALCLILASRHALETRHELILECREGSPPQVQEMLGRTLRDKYVQNNLMLSEYSCILTHLVALALESDVTPAEAGADPGDRLDLYTRVQNHPLFCPVALLTPPEKAWPD